MFERRIPEWLRHAPAPSVRGFATLAAFEAVARGILISVFPIAMYDALQDAVLISSIYFVIGIISLLTGLLVPFLNRWIARRWMYGIGAMAFVIGSGLATLGSPEMIVLGLVLNSLATVVTFVCFNAYVLDYIERVELGKCETLRMFYSALGWTVGPMLGVLLWEWWRPVPFVISGVAAAAMLGAFIFLRLGKRQTDRPGAECTCQSAGISWAFLAPTPPDRWLALCGYPLLWLVGLCCLSAHIRRREWSRRNAGRYALVDHKCWIVLVAGDAEMDAETLRAQHSSNRLHGLRPTVLCRQSGFCSPVCNCRPALCRQFLSYPLGY